MTFIPLSPCCLQGGRLTGTPRGVFQPANENQRVGRYHTTPSNGEIVDDKVALVLYTDAFGLSLPNPKIMADTFADQLKINVFVPEYIIDPPPVEVFEAVAPLYPDQYAQRSWITSIYMFGEVMWKTGRWLPMLLFPKKQVPLAQSVSVNLSGGYHVRRSTSFQGQDKSAINDLTLEGYTSLALVGYCRGGAMIQYLLSDPDNITLVGGVICHPSPEKSTWSSIHKPTIWHLADHDSMFGLKDIQNLNDVFGKKVEGEEGLRFSRTVHEDTVHGFAARPTLDHQPTKKAFEEANASAVEFCKKYLLGEGEVH